MANAIREYARRIIWRELASLAFITLTYTLAISTSLSLDPDKKPFYEEDWDKIPNAFFAEVIYSDYEIKKNESILSKEVSHKETSKLAENEDHRTIDEKFTFTLRYELRELDNSN